jgi:peroxiredoxin family protein
MQVSEEIRQDGQTQSKLAEIEERLRALEAQVQEIKSELPDNKVSIVVFSGDLDKVIASFIIATGAASMGMDVTMFFTFWGLNALKKKRDLSGKNFMEKMFALMTPVGTEGLGISKMNFFGIGAKMLRVMMKRKQIISLEELAQIAREDLGVKIVACKMAVHVMGIKPDELWDGVEIGDVASFLTEATKSKVTLFI